MDLSQHVQLQTQAAEIAALETAILANETKLSNLSCATADITAKLDRQRSEHTRLLKRHVVTLKSATRTAKYERTKTNLRTQLQRMALVELFGHQKIVGKVTESTIAGGAFLRVDVPPFDGSPAFTRFFSPGSIYSINPVTEDIARGLMERHRNEPVSRFELPQLSERVTDDDDEEDDRPPQPGHPDDIMF